MAEDELRAGQAIEFDVEGSRRVAMIQSSLPPDEEDGCTHIVEVFPSGRDKSLREERVTLDMDFGLISGRIVGSGRTTYRFTGFYLPPLPDHLPHHCTDRRWLVIFAIMVGLSGWITHYASTHGNLKNFHHAVDYKGRICGLDVPGKKFAFWCSPPFENTLDLRYPICVESCPSSNRTTHECWDRYRKRTVEWEDYETTTFLHSPYCWPTDATMLSQIREAASHRVPSPGKLLIGMPKATLAVVPISILVASIIGFTYFKLLEKCVDFIVIAFILCGTSFAFVFGVYQLLMFHQSADWWCLAYGLVALAVSLFALRLFVRAQSAITVAAGCIEAACECINQELSLLIEPVIATVIRCLILWFFLIVTALLVTTGAPQVSAEGHVRRVWGYSLEQQIYIGFTIAMALWTLELSTSLSQYVLAWVTERWYFTPYINEQKLDLERHIIVRGYAHALRHHLGTLALGSLLICVLRIPRMLFNILGSLIHPMISNRNPVRVCSIAHINKNAYIGVALTSEGFLQSAVSVDQMMNRNEEVQSVALLNGMQGIFQLGGLIVITSACGFATLIWVSIFDLLGPDIRLRDAIVVMGMAIGFPIGLSYMTLFDTVGDTILYCWAVQQRRFNYHKDHSLRGRPPRALAPGSSSGAGDAFGSTIGGAFATVSASLAAAGSIFTPSGWADSPDDYSKVRYAPPALRELVLGRHQKRPWFLDPESS